MRYQEENFHVSPAHSLPPPSPPTLNPTSPSLLLRMWRDFCHLQVNPRLAFGDGSSSLKKKVYSLRYGLAEQNMCAICSYMQHFPTKLRDLVFSALMQTQNSVTCLIRSSCASAHWMTGSHRVYLGYRRRARNITGKISVIIKYNDTFLGTRSITILLCNIYL